MKTDFLLQNKEFEETRLNPINNHRRVLARCCTVLGLLAFLLVAAASTPPLVGYAAFPGTNGLIAFVSGRDGNHEIYVMNADGSGQTNLTNSPAVDIDPAWSPDGTRIVFRSTRDGSDEIYVMNADGSGIIRLTNNSVIDYLPAWSPDGTRIVFTSFRDGNNEIYVMNDDGSDQTNLTNHPAFDSEPVWSPDGTQIAFSSRRTGGSDIYVMNADGSDQTNLTNHPAWDVSPAWSPDGTRIIFFTNRDGSYNIYMMNADGSGLVRLTNNTDWDADPVWSPDGTRIAFSRYNFQTDNWDIYVMNADGSNQTRLTDHPSFDVWPDWQPIPNVAPVGTVDHTSVVVNEGEPAANTGAYFDADTGDDVTITASVGTVSKTGTNSGTWNWSFTTLDGPTQSQMVTITFDDGHGGVSTTAFTLIVNNVAPLVNAGPEAKLLEGETFISSGSFTDPGADSWIGTVSYGDGTGSQLLTIDPDMTFSLAHLYGAAGMYSVTVTISDDDGGTAFDIVPITMLTPQQGVESIITQANELVADGVLNQGQGNALIAKLEAAIQQLDRSNTHAAVNQLQAFINQAINLIHTGVLTSEEGQPLIDAANEVIIALNS